MRFSFVAALLLVCFNTAFAQNNTNTVFRILDVPPTARTAALGGSHVALFEADFSLFQVNPAYLEPNSSGRFSASYINHLSDVQFGFFSGAWHLREIGTLGVGVRYANFGDLDKLDEFGDDFGSFSANDLALTVGLAREMLPNLRLGGSVDFLYSNIDDFNSTGISFSGGLIYEDTARELTIGLAVRNAGGQISAFDKRNEPLPLDVSAGISHKPNDFPIRGTLMMRRLNDWDQRVFGEGSQAGFGDNLARHLVLGGEVLFSENFIFRLGYNHLQHEQLKTDDGLDFAGFGFGLGLKVNRFFIDISRSSYSDIGGVFQLSIKTRIKKPGF